MHARIDNAIAKRMNRIKDAQKYKNTNQQWIPITAAIEEAVIDYFDLKGKQATKMRGRAKITYRKAERGILQGADKYVEDNVTANIKFQNRIAGTHSTQGTALITSTTA